MVAKVSAARLASRGGVPTVIADGTTPGLLPRILAGEEIGTIFLPAADRIPSRKRWIALRARSYGAIRVDAGAKRAITERGASLLPAGVVGVDGRFTMGARVDIQDGRGATFAVGLASYSSREITLIQGRPRADVKHILGYRYVNEIVNRDDMVLLSEADGNGVGV
jgi:glutamate 5-kinase